MSDRPAIQRVAVVAHDAGGARALVPVVHELRRRGLEIHPILAGPALKIWREELSRRVAGMEDKTPLPVLKAMLKRWRVDALLSAAGLYNLIEHRTRIAARGLGLPVVALLDSWFNYRERFERRPAGRTVFSPADKVCVIDSLTRREMLKAGFGKAQIVLTGHPDMEQTVNACRAVSENRRRALRRAAGILQTGMVITFISDPFYIAPGLKFYSGPGAIMRPNGTGLFGYTVREILPVVLEELETALANEKIRATLVVRPHPSEHEEAVSRILRGTRLKSLRTQLIRRGTLAGWIQISDAVLGMMSIALLQAALSGRPAISVEIGLRGSGREDPCMSNTLGYTRGIFDRRELRRVCRLIARHDWDALKPRPKHPLPFASATKRVVEVLLGGG